MTEPKILIFDIETSPLMAHVWSLWGNDVSLNQLQADWFVMSWSAKWYGAKEVMYMDQKDAKDVENDLKILKGIWKLLDEADIVVTQNGKKFDVKKLNTRFILNGMKPPSPYRHVDTYVIAKAKFGFTSNKLEYLTDKLNKKYKKSSHKKYPGHVLWTECLKGNKDAWGEMQKYNKFDVLALEELYTTLKPWDNSINYNVYTDAIVESCDCGGKIVKNGYKYTNTGKYQRYICQSCGKSVSDRTNILDKDKRKSLKK